MEIISNVQYNSKNHSVRAFVDKYVGLRAMPIIHFKVIRDAMNNRDMVGSIEVILNYKWITGDLKTGTHTGQGAYMKLAGNIDVNVYIIASAEGDRLCIMDAAVKNSIRRLSIGYVGSNETLDLYMANLGVSKFELYSGIVHLEENE